MKIIFLTDQLYLQGGTEKILSQKINYLKKNFKYNIYLITTEQRGRNPVYDLDPKINFFDLKVNYCRRVSYFAPGNLLKVFIHLYKLYSVIRRIGPDLIVSVSFSPDQYFLPFIHKAIPKIKEFHASRYNYSSWPWVRKKLDVLFSKYDVLVVLNETEKLYYPAGSVEVIPNFTNICKDTNKGLKENTVIAVGRIAPVKRFSELIEIWKCVSVDFPQWKLKIFGQGEENSINELKDIISKLNLSNRVFILPAIINIREEMHKASIYAMTSETECFPVVLLEAQACSLPIVSYDCPSGPRHIIANNHNGFLISLNDKEAFKKALSLLIQDETLRLSFGINAAENIEVFSIEKIMSQWHALFVREMHKSKNAKLL